MERTVFFRAFEEEDAILIHKWKNDDELNALTVGLNKKTCLEEDTEWVKSHMCHHPYSAYWAVCSVETGKMIGWACLTDIHYINSSANFSGIVIGDKAFHDGLAWIETYLFGLEYGFERLNLNRIYGSAIVDHKLTLSMADIMFQKTEGIFREAIYKNGRFYDEAVCAILKSEYFYHKNKGDYEIPAILKRILEKKKKSK